MRIGNAAYGHLQLDIYGELMDSLYLYDKYGSPLSYEMWSTVERLLDWVVKNWEQPDQSIWEVRGGAQDFTYSKLQCWVALDRGVRLARKRSFPTRRRHLAARSAIGSTRPSCSEGWNERSSAFTQSSARTRWTPATLMMPLMLFVSPKDPRMLSTLARIREDLASDSLVRPLRHRQGGAATACPAPKGRSRCAPSGWWRRWPAPDMVEEAQLLFEKMLSYANHLGLFSEEIGARGELIGNFPQALTHLGLISAAHNLDRILG